MKRNIIMKKLMEMIKDNITLDEWHSIMGDIEKTIITCQNLVTGKHMQDKKVIIDGLFDIMTLKDDIKAMIKPLHRNDFIPTVKELMMLYCYC